MANLTTRDPYGGCADITFGATGYFRLERPDRWWLVTPDGHAFLSLGLNHVEPGLMQRPENSAHWLARFGLGKGADRLAFPPHFQKRVQQDLRVYGSNTLGCRFRTHHYSNSFVPYVHILRFVDICHWMSPTETEFADVFAPDFASLCEEKAEAEARPRREDPYLLGYSLHGLPDLYRAGRR